MIGTGYVGLVSGACFSDSAILTDDVDLRLEQCLGVARVDADHREAIGERVRPTDAKRNPPGGPPPSAAMRTSLYFSRRTTSGGYSENAAIVSQRQVRTKLI
jgi:hypothetical protein